MKISYLWVQGILSIVLLSGMCLAETVQASVWYRQLPVELGAMLRMENPKNGVAISRGRGEDVSGQVYRFNGEVWTSVLAFPYSDFPLVAQYDSTTIWSVNHLVHFGDYRPVHTAITPDIQREISLPPVMWDAVDYAMWKDWQVFPDGTAWMVGQQGHILRYNGAQWYAVESPVHNTGSDDFFEGDLNGLSMLTPESGGAVGRDGIILRYENEAWIQIESPVTFQLYDVDVIDAEFAWAVGEKGTILQYDGRKWQRLPIVTRDNLQAVRAVSRDSAWIVGMNNTFLTLNNGTWTPDRSLEPFGDDLRDIDGVRNESGGYDLWIIGDRGIYTNAQTLGFSFSDVTENASLRRSGEAGIFYPREDRYRPDLLVLEKDSPNLVYDNTPSDRFGEITGETNLMDAPLGANVSSVGDVNNDGNQDLFFLLDQNQFRLYLGTGSGKYIDYTHQSRLTLQPVEPTANNSARFVDLDNDGNLDLYISNYDNRDMLFQGDGTGRFTDVFPSTGITKPPGHRSYGATFSDFDNDGRVDILLAYQRAVDGYLFEIYYNRGELQFQRYVDSSFVSPGGLSVLPTVTVPADLNNDNRTDIFVYNQKAPSWILQQEPDGSFTNVGEQAGFTKVFISPEPNNGIVNIADVNNDGWPDVGLGGKLYLNEPGMVFTEISNRVGIAFAGTPTFADYDDDGDQDMFIGSSRVSFGQGVRAALFRNNLNNRQFIKIRPVGNVSNRDAIGARIELLPSNGRSSGLIQRREIGLGGSPLTGQYMGEAHFGVRPGNSYSARIHFPSGKTVERKNLHPGETVTIRESKLLAHIGILTFQSIQRTFRMIRWSSHWVNLLMLLLIIAGSIFIGLRLEAKRFVTKWYFSIPALLLYFMITHFSILQPEMVSASLALGGVLLYSAGSIAAARQVLRYRDSQFVSHYKLEQLVGEGGMGKVYRATDIHSRETVAIKILHDALLEDPQNRKRLTGEGRLLSDFDHPHIVRILEYGESRNQGFLAMEYLEGGTLHDFLQVQHPLELSRIIDFTLQIGAGLSAIHARNIIHRDLKSGNIMIDGNGVLRIMDFGLSKTPLVTMMTSLGTVVGTLGYVAPEQITSVDPDTRSDIFSLGVILYELLTNQLPFTGANEMAVIHAIFNTHPAAPSSLRSDIPTDVDDIVAKCIAKSPDDRYQTMDEIVSVLEKL
ncbi:MAG: protein kinase [Candidatus Marinimicrobia bacterium]|nr:protein kinase [Candidatus Neomarinimicrobiota bacterium]MCF7827355.1 protein kinase [Candidatus Neomarinimicrobiota bacterium]MCF7881412.1 protein kinase [Candidatus Neomarinimicrobiota bacterium]